MIASKISYFKLLFCICLSSVLIGCISTGSIPKLVELDKKNIENKNNLNFSELADSCVYLKLETNKNCLIGDINDIQYVDNKIFILNNIGGENEVLIFNKDGGFINKIGTKGLGPSEYLSIGSMGINSFDKQLILIDPLKHKIHKYDYLGKFISSIPVKNECSFIYKIRFVSKNRMRYASYVNSVTSTLIAESDEDLGNQEILWQTNFSNKGGFKYAENPISTNGDYFIIPLSDCIYKYNNGELIPFFSININSKYKPVKEFENGGDFRSSFIEAIRKGFSPISSISECKHFLLIQQLGHSILWDEKNRKGFTLDNITFQPTHDYIPISGFSTISGFEDGFICLLPNSYLFKMKNYYQEEKIQPNEKIERLLRNVNMEDNPSLCIYFIKHKI